MADEYSSRKRIRQPPSVPFIWEVKPGMPRKDWKPEPSTPIAQPPSHPVKLVASVPFVWEEKPGTPLSSPLPNLIDPPLLLLPPPLLGGHGTNSPGPSTDEQELEFGSDDESSGSTTNETYSKPPAPSYPAKLVASVPFVWEEKPGTPLPYFSTQGASNVDFLLPLLPPPSWNCYEEVSSSGSNDVADVDTDDEQEEVCKSDVQTFTFEISNPSPVSLVPSRPVKLIASIPFMWEEKPGKPLPSFPRAIPPLSSDNYDPKLDLSNDWERRYDWELESFSFETDEEESSSSAPSLLANCLMPSSAILSAVPLEETHPPMNQNGPKLASSSTSSTSLSAFDTESSTSSYATGTSGPVGPAFLEWLFPLFPPKSGFLDKSGSNKRLAASTATQDLEGRDFNRQSNASFVFRRPTSLGELIMMSRRRSYRRKALMMNATA